EGSGGAKSVPSTPAPKEQTTPEVSLEQAWENFLARAKARNLRPATIYKYELLSRQMAAYAARRQIRFLQDFNLDRLEQFQAEWKEGPLSSAKKLERLKAFFRAAHIRRWVDEDPASPMQGPKVHLRPTLPFSRDQVSRILAATKFYP